MARVNILWTGSEIHREECPKINPAAVLHNWTFRVQESEVDREGRA